MNEVTCRALAALALMLLIAGCQTTPATQAGKDNVIDAAQEMVDRFQAEDPSLRDVLHRAQGYAAFPRAGKGGFIVGGGYGRGVVYDQGRMIGFADITQATVGAQVGGQSFEQLVVFETREALDRFKNNQLAFAANASAVALTKGGAATASYDNGVLVFIEPKRGAMLEAAIGGQKFTFAADETAAAAAPAGHTDADRRGDDARRDDVNRDTAPDVRIETQTEPPQSP